MTVDGRAGGRIPQDAPEPAWMRRLLDGLGRIPPSYFSRFQPPQEGGRASAVLMHMQDRPDVRLHHQFLGDEPSRHATGGGVTVRVLVVGHRFPSAERSSECAR